MQSSNTFVTSLFRSADSTPSSKSKMRSGTGNSKERNSRNRRKDIAWAKSVNHGKPPGTRTFKNVYFRQKFRGLGGSIWTMKFNKSGTYFAVGGESPVVKVFKVMDSIIRSEQRSSVDDADEAKPFFEPNPVRVFEGHTKPVVDLDWSQANFLLTASMDTTVRLWHSARGECLRIFKHGDVVSSVVFHPCDNITFLTGCFNGKLQMWSMVQSSSVCAANAEDYISSAAISNDGQSAIVGTVNGRVKFYSMRNEVTREWKLNDTTQIDVRPERAFEVRIGSEDGVKRDLSKKVCAIVPSPSDKEILITTNDAHVRTYMKNDKSLTRLYKGHVAVNNSLRGTYSNDERFLMSPLGKVLSIWDKNEAGVILTKGRNRVEVVHAYEAITLEDERANSKEKLTGALFAPSSDHTDTGNYTIVTASSGGTITVLQRANLDNEVHRPNPEEGGLQRR
ncbi:hypothetical protein NDN08_005512 [Rhodosorus marinus]|uniref:WD repeat-containing protein 44 n=1 Tax=Rhodosorus marinus TaxID=101924 RepID=A0AAV8V1S2_9RHOD|nr:hypothetical protein NDN08_005512 [Rhodosorus marinus]